MNRKSIKIIIDQLNKYIDNDAGKCIKDKELLAQNLLDALTGDVKLSEEGYHPVRLILKQTDSVGAEGQGITENFKTLDINNAELEDYLLSNSGFSAYKVIGAELLNAKEANKRKELEWMERFTKDESLAETLAEGL